jgi:hypothetical protein
VQDHFERHEALKLALLRFVHDPHAATADLSAVKNVQVHQLPKQLGKLRSFRRTDVIAQVRSPT